MWSGILIVQEIWCCDADENVLWKRENIRNTLHMEGQQFMLLSLFQGGASANPYIPINYFLGLDNRPEVKAEDTLGGLSGEPLANGYARQAISSTTGFNVQPLDNTWRATTPVATFRASGGGWGPVRNLFLATSADTNGYLISTANLGSSFVVNDGQLVNLRFSLSLRDC